MFGIYEAKKVYANDQHFMHNDNLKTAILGVQNSINVEYIQNFYESLQQCYKWINQILT